MGITDLLKELPGGNVKTSTRYGFANLTILRSFLASIDTSTLLFVYAIRHKDAYNAGNYIPSAKEFQRQIIAMNLLHKWDYTLVFNGCGDAAVRERRRPRVAQE